MSVQIKYRTFDELLASVLSDFKTYDQEGMIDPQDLIKIAQKINTQLSVKINKNKQKILEIEKGRVKLPNDYFKLNLAFILSERVVSTPVLHGVQTEDVLVLPNDCDNPSPIPFSNFNGSCREGTVRMTECCKRYEVVQYFRNSTYTYKQLHKIRIEDGPGIEFDCPNRTFKSDFSAYVKNGWLYTNVDSGKLYISYISIMEDEEGNLLVLDDNIINEYYEYALKERILENLLMNGEDVAGKLNFIAGKRKSAHLEAVTRAGMFEFDELEKMWEMNRRAMYKKYYYQFI